jgi:hypothetical protein
MDKITAQRIVSQTFKAAFDKRRYRDFINELCNGFDESKAITSMGVPDAFALHVKSCQRLGTFEAPDGELTDVLVVYLTESFKLERTRTALRDFVAHKLKRAESYKEAGLVAFVGPDAHSWRFSYVRMDYETRRDPRTGKIKSEERLTPARRYSYLVGVDEECHTAQSRFLALLQNTGDKPTLAEIEDAFSVESVTEEFFREYVRLFEDTEAALAAVVKRDKTIGDDFKEKGVTSVDFAKKLLGQIVFLYFIQKKGWLGVAKGGKWGDGPRNFLRQLASRALGEKKCLFNDVLEPLFYDTLATNRGAEAWCKILACRIPFLNGGLFEPLAGYDWKETDIDLPNGLFTNQTRSAAGDTGTGILDVLDRYNFTVNEAEPLEKEVAIDPEMLGKVFENLIEDNRRKGLGAFYTPREIVHFMCQESLINYLDTTLNHPAEPIAEGRRMQAQLFGDVPQEQTLLATSVAREVIARSEIEIFIRHGGQAAHYEAARRDGTLSYDRKLPKAVETHAGALDRALERITVCDPAIGSGAFPVGMMTEIVRARTTLTPYLSDLPERTAYHFKRHVIQSSIYGVDIDPGAVEIAKLRLWLSLVVDEDDVQEIKPLPNLDYKVVVGNSLLGFPFRSPKVQRIEKLKAEYFDETDHDKKQRLKLDIDFELAQAFAASKASLGYEVAFDFEIYFSEVFRTNKGFDVVIGNPPWGADLSEVETRTLGARYRSVPSKTKDSYFYFICRGFEILRPSGALALIVPNTWLLINSATAFRRHILSFDIREIIDYGDGIFAKATVESATLIALRQQSTARMCRARKLRRGETVVDHQAEKSLWLDDPYSRIIVDVRAQDAALLKKLKSENDPFDKDCVIIWGIKPYQVGHGTPPQTREMLEKRIYHSRNQQGAEWKPLIVGSDVNRYVVRFPGDRFIKYGKWLMYPSNESLMLLPKLLIRQTSDILRCGFDDSGLYCQNSVFIVHTETMDLKYLLGLLNSKLLGFVYRCGNPQKGKVFAEIKPSVIKALPIRRIPESEQRAFVKLVEKILAAKKRDPSAVTDEAEKEIDRLVYALYGLKNDEIAIVEASA